MILKATPHNTVCDDLLSFYANTALQKFEIHKVFLHFAPCFGAKCRRNPLLPDYAVLP